jgi:small-conductance mechanosensitive channel
VLETIREWLDFRLFEVSGTVVSGASLLTFVLIVLASFWISRVVQRVALKVMRRSGIEGEDTLTTTLRLLHYTVLIVGVGVALQTIGISFTTVFTAGAVAAVAVGFALQNILQNFVSGIILLAERSITETDVLEVEGSVMRVEKMGARATVARTRDDEELIIPNSILVQSTVKNLTLTDATYRIRAKVGVEYAADIGETERVLHAAAASLQSRSLQREPVVFLKEFGDSSVNWEVSIWGTNPWTAPVTRSDLNKAIWWGLKNAGIGIPFPQVDLHVRSGIEMGTTRD